MNDTPLKLSSVVQYFGAYIDDDLNWSAHIEHLQKQVGRLTALLSKLRHYVNIKVRRTLYYSLIHSHLNTVLLYTGPQIKLFSKNYKSFKVIL